MSKRIITISREFGSGGRTIGKMVAEKLGIAFYDKELITLAAEESGFAEHLFEKNDRNITNSLLYSLSMYGNTMGLYDMPLNDKLFIAQSKTIQNVAEKGPCVIVGRCADYVLRNKPNVLNVFIHSDMESKVRRVVEDYGVESDNVVELINKTDKRRASYYEYYSSQKWGAVESYDFCMDSSYLGLGGTVELIRAMVEHKEHPILSPTEEDPTRPAEK